VVALLAIPAASILPDPPDVGPGTILIWIANGWLLLLIASSAVVFLYYLIGPERAGIVATLNSELSALRNTMADPLDPASGRRANQSTQLIRGFEEKVRSLETSARLHEEQHRIELELAAEKVAAVESERAQLADRCARLEADSFRYWALWTYGAEFVEFDRQLSPEQAITVREKIDEMRTGLGQMLEPAYKVWGRVAERMCGDGEDSFGYLHAETVSEGCAFSKR
jgi:hypothetical protein